MRNRVSSELLGFDKSIAIKLKKKIEAFGLTSDLCLAAMTLREESPFFLTSAVRQVVKQERFFERVQFNVSRYHFRVSFVCLLICVLFVFCLLLSKRKI